MQERADSYWNEGVDSKAFCINLLYRLPYIVLLGVAGVVLGSGLYLLIAWFDARETVYQAETEYYINFAEGRLEAKDHYNDFTWNDVMATDLILGRSMELLGEEYQRAEVKEMITADILSDVRYLTITVTGDEPKKVEAVSEATKSSLEIFGATKEEFDSIEQIEDNGVVLQEVPYFTWRAAALGFLIAIGISFLWFMVKLIIGDAPYTKTDVMKMFSVLPLGILYSRDSKMQKESVKDLVCQIEYQLQKKKAQDTDNKKTDVILLDLLQMKGTQGTDICLQNMQQELIEMEEESISFHIDYINKNGCYKRCREARAVVIMIPFGQSCRQKIEDALLKLKMQDCLVIGAVLTGADEKWMRLYGLGRKEQEDNR